MVTKYLQNQNFFNLLMIIITATIQTANVTIETILAFDISPLGIFAVPLSNNAFSSTE